MAQDIGPVEFSPYAPSWSGGRVTEGWTHRGYLYHDTPLVESDKRGLSEVRRRRSALAAVDDRDIVAAYEAAFGAS